MKREWTDDELIEHWTLLPHEMEWLTNKTGATRLPLRCVAQVFPTRRLLPTLAA